MTLLQSLAERVVSQAGGYGRCAPDQAMVYACEDVLETQFPSRAIDIDDVVRFVEDICASEGIETPMIGRLGRRQTSGRRIVATADIDADEIRFESTGATVPTILHELAHLMSGMDDHGMLFRDAHVRLMRRHCDVGRAAMLHGLYTACGLQMSPWAASAR